MQKTLHIALCDTNFADRKQMERLLSRESDKRQPEHMIYVETFGSTGALLDNKRIYDAYFLDVPDTEFSAYDVALHLQERGVHSPVILCISTMDYRKQGALQGQSIFLNKPIQTRELSLIIDKIIMEKEISYIPTIEFRNAVNTYYLEAKDIMFIEQDAGPMYIHLANGQIKEAQGNLENIFNDFIPYPSFFMPCKKYIINGHFVEKVQLHKIYMPKDITLPIPLGASRKTRQFLQTL